MIWLVLRVIGYVLLIAAIAAVLSLLVDAEGRVAISWGGVDYQSLTLVEAIAALAVVMIVLFVLFKALQLLIATIRFVLGDETALTRFWARSRERRGLDAYSRGVVALAEGDLKRADAAARRATKLLGERDLTILLEAQVAEAAGDTARAKRQYRLLAKEPPTAMVGVKGLLAQAVKGDETERAMKLAEHAFAIRPKDPVVQQTLFELQTRAGDWLGAQGTVQAMLKSRTLPKDVARRRLAVLDLEIARRAAADGQNAAARQAVDAALRVLPHFGPAAALGARIHAPESGKAKSRAAKNLREAWKAEPTPETAQAFAELEPEETPSERRRRFRDLLDANPEHYESRLLAAELALADNDYHGARRALGDLVETRQTHRALVTMAAIEKGEGAPESVIRGYLARAVTAPRGPHWVCDNCAASPGAWSAVCPNCRHFDTLSWREKAEAPDQQQQLDGAMTPLMVESGIHDEDVRRRAHEPGDFDRDREGPREKDEADRLDEEAAEEAVRESEEARV